jgi:hypothetical protein
MMKKFREEQINVNGKEISYYKVNHDVNGNPRYVTHFLDLGVEPEDYGKVPGLEKYRAKWFGGGYVFQSYNLQEDLPYYLDKVEDYYNKKKN